MKHLLGLLKIHVHRGVNLANRNVRSSNPYVVIRMDKEKLKTRVVKKNTNPEWNDDLTLSIADPSLPIKLLVYDKHKFSHDDKMGDAEIQIGPFLDALRMRLDDVPSGTVITRVKPGQDNCLAEESCIVWSDGKVVQDLVLRLCNVEHSEVELQLEWIDIPGSRGLQ
ncbi:C2 domain-containing protein, partial [Psidium guajava]